MTYDFKIGKEYRRRDIYKILGIPEDIKGGNWDTGYNRHGDDWFLFCNVGVPGTTGHDYQNEFVGDDLRWFGKTHSQLSHSSIQSMVNGVGQVYVFARTDQRAPFTFAGTGVAVETKDNVPVEVRWRFVEGSEARPEVPPEEVVVPHPLFEGATKTIQVNVYERNPIARRLCIEHYGCLCAACGLNLEGIYGDIARGFIHVHHLKPLHEVGAQYQIDPLSDLRPVCPNCHAILHRRQPPLSIEELQQCIQAPKSGVPTPEQGTLD